MQGDSARIVFAVPGTTAPTSCVRFHRLEAGHSSTTCLPEPEPRASIAIDQPPIKTRTITIQCLAPHRVRAALEKRKQSVGFSCQCEQGSGGQRRSHRGRSDTGRRSQG